MFTHRLNILATALTVVGLPVIFDGLLPSQSVLGATSYYMKDINGKFSVFEITKSPIFR
jgi:hypothetical protein